MCRPFILALPRHVELMATETWVSIDAPVEWGSALEGLPHSIGHTWGYCQAVSASSGLPTFLFCREDESGRIVCPLSERAYQGEVDVVTPYGIAGFTGSGSATAGVNALGKSATTRGYIAGYIRLNPLLVSDVKCGADVIREKTLYVLDLRLPQDELFARGRREFRAPALKAGDEIVLDRTALTEFLVAEYGRFMERMTAAAVHRLSPQSLRSLCNLEGTILIGAGRAGRLEAVAMFGHTEFCADYLFAVSLPDGRGHSASLVWAAIQELKRLAVPCLNLGGGLREGDRLADFKRRLGGEEVPLLVVRQIYDRDRFQALCRAADVNPAGPYTYFPPYHGNR